MAELQAILRELDELEPEELQKVQQYIEKRQMPQLPRGKRIMDLHPRAITTTDDFDAPLIHLTK